MNHDCRTCRLREKVHGFDDNGGDFWRCLAEPRIPAFTGGYLAGFVGRAALVNLRSFDDEHPCHENQRAKECPLWELRAE